MTSNSFSKEVVHTDADNTLWDTDAVYADAQLSLLSDIESALGVTLAEADRLNLVRRADQDIAEIHELGLRYPPRLLIEALLEDAVLPESFILEIERLFVERVRHSVPVLRLGVREGLEDLLSGQVSTVIVTESGAGRCQDLLKTHRIDHLIHRVISSKKTPALFTELAQVSPVGYFVGDQLDVDILFAHQAGFSTIYFPSKFVPQWARRIRDVSEYKITSFAEVPQIVFANRTERTGRR